MAKDKINLSKSEEITTNLYNYFSNFEFEKRFNLFHNIPLNLHWSDARALTEKVRYQTKRGDESFDLQKKFVSDTIQSLKNVPLWLRYEDTIVAMTMFDVYQGLGQYIKKEAMEDELFNSQEISFIGPTGPFKDMPLINCINGATFNLFLHWQVMVNKLPQRSFRMNTQGHVMADFMGINHTKTNMLKIEQITDTGLLFSSQNDFLLEHIDASDELKIYFNTSRLFDAVKNGQNNKNEDLFFSRDKLHYFKIDQHKISKKLKYNSHESGDFFLFCRYFDMTESEVPELMKTFTKETKKIILDAAA